MMSSTKVGELEAQLLQLDWGKPDCRAKILEFRRVMDAACDRGEITLKEWRVLVEKASFVQEKCVSKEPDGWRRPPPKGRSNG